MTGREWVLELRRLCTCGMHGLGKEVDDTPEVRAKLNACPAHALAQRDMSRVEE